jgi:hypothetical protein
MGVLGTCRGGSVLAELVTLAIGKCQTVGGGKGLRVDRCVEAIAEAKKNPIVLTRLAVLHVMNRVLIPQRLVHRKGISPKFCVPRLKKWVQHSPTSIASRLQWTLLNKKDFMFNSSIRRLRANR